MSTASFDELLKWWRGAKWADRDGFLASMGGSPSGLRTWDTETVSRMVRTYRSLYPWHRREFERLAIVPYVTMDL